MNRILFVAAGGGLGAVGRFFLGNICHKILGQGFPYGTLAVNILGCLLMGSVMAYLHRDPSLNSELKLFLTTGFLGGFTTFSAFSADFVLMLQGFAYQKALVYCLSSVLLSLLATLLGVSIGRWFFVRIF